MAKKKNRGAIKKQDVVEDAARNDGGDSIPEASITGQKRKRAEGDDEQAPPQQAPEVDANADVDESQWRSKAITKLSQFPRNMVKYWYSRHRLFTQYDNGILLDLESWYSITPESIANRTATRCNMNSNKTILDVFAGCGGNSIQFALAGARVISIEIDPIKVQMAKHNAKIYGIEDRIEFRIGDGVQFLRDWKSSTTNLDQENVAPTAIDVVFLSPPWGGVEYQGTGTIETNTSSKSRLNYKYYPLSALAPLSGQELYTLSRRITQNVVMYLPRTCDLDELVSLVDDGEIVDVEEQWMGDSFKALCVYFGHDLVHGWREP